MSGATKYRDLVLIAESLTATDFYRRHSFEEAQAYLAANAERLEAARQLLRQSCCVPLAYDRNYVSRQGESTAALRRLGSSLALAAQFARSNGAIGPALDDGLNLIRLSHGARRGGVLCDAVGAHGIELMGIVVLRCLRSGLRPKEGMALSGRLAALLTEREKFDAILARDREFDIRVGVADDQDGSEFLDPEVAEIVARWTPEKMLRDCLHADNRNVALLRLLLVDVSLRAFRALRGELPAQLSELVPEFIREVPDDPFTNRPLQYHRRGADFAVYSVGPSGVDPKEKFGHWSEVESGKADLNLDVFDCNVNV